MTSRLQIDPRPGTLGASGDEPGDGMNVLEAANSERAYERPHDADPRMHQRPAILGRSMAAQPAPPPLPRHLRLPGLRIPFQRPRTWFFSRTVSSSTVVGRRALEDAPELAVKGFANRKLEWR